MKSTEKGRVRGLGLASAIAGLAVASGCASVVPRSETVLLTREAAAVSGCKEVGTVQSWLSFSFRDADNQLRNRALALGADTVLVSSPFGDTTGIAYLCGKK